MKSRAEKNEQRTTVKPLLKQKQVIIIVCGSAIAALTVLLIIVFNVFNKDEIKAKPQPEVALSSSLPAGLNIPEIKKDSLAGRSGQQQFRLMKPEISQSSNPAE